MTSPSDPTPTASSAPPVAWEAPKEEIGPAPGVKFAGYGARLVAYILDVVILSIALSLFFTATLDMAISGDTAGDTGTGILILLGIILSLAYFPFFWAWSGQTPGMRPFKLFVVRDRDGGPISIGQALLRLIGVIISSVPLYIGFIWVFIDARRRGWHDLIARTVVVERRLS
jgi:uncharacterized RDD family membrane protein YckC